MGISLAFESGECSTSEMLIVVAPHSRATSCISITSLVRPWFEMEMTTSFSSTLISRFEKRSGVAATAASPDQFHLMEINRRKRGAQRVDLPVDDARGESRQPLGFGVGRIGVLNSMGIKTA